MRTSFVAYKRYKGSKNSSGHWAKHWNQFTSIKRGIHIYLFFGTPCSLQHTYSSWRTTTLVLPWRYLVSHHNSVICICHQKPYRILKDIFNEVLTFFHFCLHFGFMMIFWGINTPEVFAGMTSFTTTFKKKFQVSL